MRCPALLPLALLSASILTACGARPTLAEPGDCGAWSLREGTAGQSSAAWSFAVRDDGSVVLPLHLADSGTPATPGSRGITLRSLDVEGDAAWSRAVEPHVMSITGVARDAEGRLFVAGTMEAGDWPVLGKTLSCPSGAWCAFVGGLDEGGALTWSKVIAPADAAASTPSSLQPLRLAVTGDGRVTLAGLYGSTADFGCGPVAGAGTPHEPSYYLAQLSPSGACLWSRAIVFGAAMGAPHIHIAVDDAGEVAFGIGLRTAPDAGTLDLGAGPVAFDGTKGAGFAVAKYAPNGDVAFARAVSGGAGTTVVNVGLTGTGELLLVTSYDGVVDLGGGPRGSAGTARSFVSKLGATGEEVWTRDLTGGSLAARFEIAVAPEGGFTLAGPGLPGMTLLGEPTGADTLLAATFDAAGEPLDLHTFPSTAPAYVDGMGVASDGALVLAGVFTGSLDFGQGELVAEGEADAFVARICR